MLPSSHQATFVEYFWGRILITLCSGIFSMRYFRFQRISLLFLWNHNLRDWKWHVCLYPPMPCLPTWVSLTGPSKEPHMSFYPWSWLHRNSYDPPLNKEQTSNEWVLHYNFLLHTKMRNIASKVLWGSKIIKSPPTVAYEKVMSDDRGLFEWLSNVVSCRLHSSLHTHCLIVP